MTKYARTTGGNWNADATWSSTSGGGADTTVPTSADDVVLDANSGNVTITATAACRSIDCTGYIGTLTHNTAITLSIGDATAGASNIALKFVAGMTYTKGNADTSAISFVSTSATVQTIDSGGKTFGHTTFDGTGGSWQLITGLILSTNASLTLTRGTLDVNGQTCSFGRLASNNSNTRTLTLGAASITITATSGTGLDFTTVTGFTFNADTSTLTFNSGVSFLGGGKTFYNVVATGGFGTYTGSNIFNDFTCVPAAGARPAFVLSNNMTINGTLTLTGTDTASEAGRVQFFSTTFPSNGAVPRTITANAVSLTNVDFFDIIAAGNSVSGGPWTGTRLGGIAASLTNITIDTPRTLYWVATGATGNNLSNPARWSTTSGGSADTHAPLPQDTGRFDENSIDTTGRTIVFNSRVSCNIDFTGVTNNPAINTGLIPHIIPGDFILADGMTCVQNGRYSLNGRGNHIFKPANVEMKSNQSIAIDIGAYNGGSYTLQSDFLLTGNQINFSLTIGTFDANGFDITIPIFASSNTNGRTINMGTGTWTITGTGTIWNCSNVNGLTTNGVDATVILSDVSASTKLFEQRNSGTIGHLILPGGGGAVTLSRDGRYGTITVNKPKTVSFHNLGTFIIFDDLIAVGDAIDPIVFKSEVGGDAASITKTSGRINLDYINMTDIAVSGGAVWYAGSHSTDVSGNSGWIWGDQPATELKLVGGILETNIKKIAKEPIEQVKKLTGLING